MPGILYSSLLPADEDEVRILIARFSIKSCCLDHIPVQLIKLWMDQLVPIITQITNIAPTSGVMPSTYTITEEYIMAGRAFVAAKGVFIMETVVFWHCDNG